jgi:Clr5 domain
MNNNLPRLPITADSQGVPMPSAEAGPRRPCLTQHDWTSIRPTFERLWCREGKCLPEVMKILSRDYAFDAT